MKKYRKLALGGPGPVDPEKKKIDLSAALNQLRNYSLPEINLNLNGTPFELNTPTPDPNNIAPTAFSTLKNIDGSTATKKDLTGGIKKKDKFDWKKLAGKASALAPFASNIANSFNKAPKVKKPNLLSYQTLKKVNLNNERSEITRAGETSDRATERNVDSNTAEAVKQFNRGQTIQRLGAVGEKERNANIAIGNQQATLDMQVDYTNKAKKDTFQDTETARRIAEQTQRSANFANAADKLIGIRNEKEKNRVDLEKTKTLAGMYDPSGVMKRARAKMRDSGIQDPLGLDFSDLDDDDKKTDKKAYGGEFDAKERLARRGVTGLPIKTKPLTGGIERIGSRDNYGYPIPTAEQYRKDPEFYGRTPSTQILGKYSSMVGNGTGQPIPNSQYGKLLNNLNYMKNNWWDTSNVYRPENQHIAANYDIIKAKTNSTIMRYGGRLRNLK